MASVITNAGLVNHFEGGGFTTVDSAGTMVQLMAFVSSSAHEATFRLPTGTSGYQLTSGGFLLKYAVVFPGYTSALSVGPRLLFSTNDVGQDASTGSVTGAVYMGGNANNANIGGGWLMTSAPTGIITAINWLIPFASPGFISMVGGGQTNVHLWGIPQ